MSRSYEEALFCNKCGERVSFVEEHSSPDFSHGEIVLMSCRSGTCKEKPWFFCNSCQSRGYFNGLVRHAGRNKHKRQHALAFPGEQREQENNKAQRREDVPQEYAIQTNDANEANDAMAADICTKLGDNNSVISVAGVQNNDRINDVSMDQVQVNKDDTTTKFWYFPKIKLGGNEWLEKTFKDTEFATKPQVMEAFSSPELVHMRNFYVAELASGEGQCGAGLSFLAARAFQQIQSGQLDDKLYPEYAEAKWQMINMIQYQSFNEKQRRRQALLNDSLMTFFPPDTQGKFFKATFLPQYNQLGRYYGVTGQHSMYNNLPCPRAVDVDGVAYTSPRAIIAFVLANGIPIDDIAVTRNTPVFPEPAYLRRVHNVDESLKAVEWIQGIQRDYYGSNSGAPDSNSNTSAPKYPAVICLYLSDWTDGFDSGRVKSNRNAIDSKTLTVSPPKCLVNATDNTFPVAIGLKKATGWKKVERMFRSEVEELTNASEPVLFYHGTIKKMVPCFFKRFAVLSDKQERNGLTGTLGCGSDIHRCFGVAGKIETPSCKLAELQEFLREERQSTPYGWAEQFVDGNRNGATFPSCGACRRGGLEKLLGLREMGVETAPCDQCQDWDLIAPNKSCNPDLVFPAHRDYPTAAAPGSPVPPPEGRDVFQEGSSLPFIRITWKVMIHACKFAFYQASRRSGWKKSETKCYLKHCGVSEKLAGVLHDVAKACLKDNGSVDYGQPDKIGSFQFDPAWLSGEVALQDFIEAVMHQLFLGAAESNLELISTWLSETPSAAKLGNSSFLQVFQTLIKDLRGFNLSWLLAYPLTGKKGKLGTGSWVAENWVFFVRISQFALGWCKKSEMASKYGVEDMSRMVTAYHAFVARCLTHAGIDGEGINEAELYLKEFLSALREFDIRVRHKKLNKPVEKVSERKGTEAWWLKPNYMSLCNLLYILRVLGPLVLWWDGGGKGEKFIQVVKPLIKKGVRDDVREFFVKLLEKLYRVRIIDILEDRFDLEQKAEDEEVELDDDLMDVLQELADMILPEQDETASQGVEEEDNEEEEEEEEEEENQRDAFYFSNNEAHGMTKKKAFFVYRNEKELNEALTSQKPIAGIVEVKKTGEGDETFFDFQAVFRKPCKKFGRRRVVFQDNEGLNFHGMWCAPITVEEQELPETSEFKDLQEAAKLSAVAIPLWYIIGTGKPDSHKYCVITNWWKYRMKDGVYRLPTLDPDLYESVKQDFQDDTLLNEAALRPRRGRRVTRGEV